MSVYLSYFKSYYILLFILVLGAFLRIYGLGDQTYWLDEIITLKVAQGELEPIIYGTRPFLYLTMAHYWFGIFGQSEFATRSLSVIFGIASIPLIYIVGRRLFNQKVGLISAFIMALSVYQIYYSQELRYYALFQFLTLASFYFYIRLLSSKSFTDTALYIISTALVFYSHDIGVLVIPVQNIYLLLRYKTLRTMVYRWIITQFIVLASISPKLIFTFTTDVVGESGPNWITEPDIWAPVYTIYRFLGVNVDFIYFVYGCAALLVLLAAIALYIYIPGIWKEKKPRDKKTISRKLHWAPKSETILILLWLIVPIAFVYIASFIFKPMYLVRYLILTAPACYILAALLIDKIKKPVLTAIILIIFVFLNLPGHYIQYTGSFRENWRGMIDYIHQNHDVDKTLILIPTENKKSFKWYNKKDGFEYCSIPKAPRSVPDFLNRCNVGEYDTFWVIFPYIKFNNDPQVSYIEYRNTNYRVKQEGQFIYVKNHSATLFSFEKSGR